MKTEIITPNELEALKKELKKITIKIEKLTSVKDRLSETIKALE